MSKTPTTPPNDLRALIAEALHAYELARATYLKSMAIGRAEQERSSHLLASIQQVKEAARDLLEKAGLAHIAGAPLSLDGIAAPVRRVDESVAATFAAARLAAADLRAGLLQLARTYVNVSRWEEARRVLQPLLSDTTSPWYIDARDLWCETYYIPAVAAFQGQDWANARQGFEVVIKTNSQYRDTVAQLSNIYARFPEYTSQIWQTGLINCVGILHHQEPVQSVAFSPSRQILASTSFYTLKLWNLASQTEILSIDSPCHGTPRVLITQIDFAGEQVIVGFCRPGVQYDFHFTFHFEIPFKKFSVNGSVANPNKKKKLSIGDDLSIEYKPGKSNVTVQDKQASEILVLEHTGGINDIATSTDGSLLATAGNDGTVRLWGPKI